MKNLKELKKNLPPSLEFRSGGVYIIDQLYLPERLKFKRLNNYLSAIEAIKNMRIRGAQAIAAAGAAGVYLAAIKYRGQDPKKFLSHLKIKGREIKRARPTAHNLSWAVETMLADLQSDKVLNLKKEITLRFKDLLVREENNNIKLGAWGERLIKKGARIMTHCNAGSLSSIWFGTASAPVYQAWLKGKKISLWVDETRPWLQGTRLTAWEFSRAGLDFQINVDSASGYLMSHGLVDLVIVGADRIALNGDTANKIGTYPLALMAKKHKIPFYVAAVKATIDEELKNGKNIKIEERKSREIIENTKYWDRPIAPKGTKAFNPVFDVTPAELITGFITEDGVFKAKELKNLFK